MQKGLVPNMSDIMEMFNSPVVGAIQYDENIHISTNKGIPIVCKKDTYIEHNFIDIAVRIIQ